MTCHADKAALRNYVRTCPIRDLHSLFRLCSRPAEKWNIGLLYKKKEAVRKKKDFEIFGGEWR